MKTKKTKMLMSFMNTLCNKNRQTQSKNTKRYEGVECKKSPLLTKRAGHWPRSLFAFLWTSTRSIKTQKENLANIPAILVDNI